MRIVISVFLFLLLEGGSVAQQMLSSEGEHYPREAESILIASCRVVGERLNVPMPNPQVQLRLGEPRDAAETEGRDHIIHLRRWNRTLFKHAAIEVCLSAAEFDIVPVLATKVPDR